MGDMGGLTPHPDKNQAKSVRMKNGKFDLFWTRHFGVLSGVLRTRYLYPSPSTNNGRSPDHPGALGVYLDAHAISSSVRVMINYNYNF